MTTPEPTAKPVATATDERLRIALAKWRGWNWTSYGKDQVRIQAPAGYGPCDTWRGADEANSITLPLNRRTVDEFIHDIISAFPNYPADLNAVAELEGRLSEEQWKDYICELGGRDTSWKGGKALVSAKARTKCLALVRALGLEVV